MHRGPTHADPNHVNHLVEKALVICMAEHARQITERVDARFDQLMKALESSKMSSKRRVRRSQSSEPSGDGYGGTAHDGDDDGDDGDTLKFASTPLPVEEVARSIKMKKKSTSAQK